MEKTVLTQEQINILYKIFKLFDEAAMQCGMTYTLAAGSALGAVRHNGLIPWDDDGDLYVTDIEFAAHEYAIWHEATKRNLKIELHTLDEYPAYGWYKIFLAGHKFPNVDIFLLKKEADGVWRMANSSARKWWPKEALTDEQITGIRKVRFGPLQLSLFGNPEMYLKATYGDDWNKVAWDGYDHVNERMRPERANERIITSYSPALPTLMA
jgi:lipopolysaccharide cholinephosphotransferase